MASEKVFVGEAGAKELYRRIKEIIPGAVTVVDEVSIESMDAVTSHAVALAVGNLTGFQKVDGTGADNHPDVNDPNTRTIYLVKIPEIPGEDKYKEWIWAISQNVGSWECIGSTSIVENAWKQWSDDHGSTGSASSVYIGPNNSATRVESFVFGSSNTAVATDNTDYSGTDVVLIGSDNTATNAAYAYQLGHGNTVTGNSLQFINSTSPNYPLAAMNFGTQNTVVCEGINIGKRNDAEYFGISIGEDIESINAGIAIGRSSRRTGQEYANEKTYASGSSIAIGNNAYAAASSVSISSVPYVYLNTSVRYNYANGGSVALGAANSANGQSIAIGHVNTAAGASFAVGDQNSSSGSGLAFGKRNSASNEGISIGLDNVTTDIVPGCGKSVAVGTSNVAMQYGFAVGRDNVINRMDTGINSSNSYSFGENNVIYGLGYAYGIGNRMGSREVVDDQESLVLAAFAFAYGARNTLNGSSFVVGYDNTADSDAFIFGRNNAGYTGAVILGKTNYGIESSVAVGLGNKATNESIAIGHRNRMGLFSNAETNQESPLLNDVYGIALGHDNLSERGGYNILLGQSNVSGNDGIAIGSNNTAFGYAWIIGKNNAAGNASGNPDGGHCSIIGVSNTSTSTLKTIKKTLPVLVNGIPVDRQYVLYNAILPLMPREAPVDITLSDAIERLDIAYAVLSEYIDDEALATDYSALIALPTVQQILQQLSLTSLWTYSYPTVMSIYYHNQGMEPGSTTTQVECNSSIIGVENASGHYNSILIGAKNTSLAPQTEASVTDDDGFTVAVGFNNVVERNYDFAFGYMSEARGGENIAITASHAYGYRNLAYNHSFIRGVCNIATNEAILSTSVSGEEYPKDYICYNELYHSIVEYNASNKRYENAFTENIFRNVDAVISAYHYGATGNVIFNNLANEYEHTRLNVKAACFSENFFVDVGTRKWGNLVTEGFSLSVYDPSSTYATVENNCLMYTNAQVENIKSFGSNFAVMSELNIHLNPPSADDSVVNNNVLLNGKLIGTDSVKHSSVTHNLISGNSVLNIAGCSTSDGGKGVVQNNVLLGNSSLVAANANPSWNGNTHCATGNFLFGSQGESNQETVSFLGNMVKNTLRVFNFGPNTVRSSYDTMVGGASNAITGTRHSFIFGCLNTLDESYTTYSNSPNDMLFGDLFILGGNNHIDCTFPDHSGDSPKIGRCYLFGDNNEIIQSETFETHAIGSDNHIGFASATRVSYDAVVNATVSKDTMYMLTERVTLPRGNESITTSVVMKTLDGQVLPVPEREAQDTGSTVIGNRNNIYPGVCWSTVVGNVNEISNKLPYATSGSFIQGNNNCSADGSNAILMGNGNKSSGHNAVAVGCQLVADQWQTVIGKYNAPKAGPSRVIAGFSEETTYESGQVVYHEDGYYQYASLAPSKGAWDSAKWARFTPEADKALFVVGNGYSERDDNQWQKEQYIHRSNAMEVYADGTVKAHDFVSDNELDLAGANGIAVSEDLGNARLVISLDSETASVINFLKNRPAQGTYGIQCTDGILSWVAIGTV